MPRRAHVPHLAVGSLELPESESHHLRNVLRLQPDDKIELFDDTGRTALARVVDISHARITVQINTVDASVPPTTKITVASALPKGDRADWMIEKLSELGVSRFIPLQTERSVVHPEGKNKRDRWTRIATESAKQSHRIGVMQIDALTPLGQVLSSIANALYLSPDPAARALVSNLKAEDERITLIIGPEGGWSENEIALFAARNITPARLTDTILRIETAAITAAALAACASLRPPSL